MTLLMKLNETKQEGFKYGDAQRVVRAVEKLMSKFQFSLEEACNACDSTMEEYYEAVELLKNEDEFM